MRVHGALVKVEGTGVLLLRASGVGKSETALELVIRGGPRQPDVGWHLPVQDTRPG